MGKGKRDESMCLYVVTRCFKICIRCYLNCWLCSAEHALLCVSYLWPFFYWVLYLFTKRLWEEYAHWIPLPFLFRMNKRFTLEILFGIGQYRAINHVHYKFLGTCWLVLLFQFCLFIQCIWYFCLACVCAISICWVMIGHFCSSFVFTQC